MNQKKQTVFETVAEKIRDKVKTGYYVSAQKLPSEYDLAKEYDVSRLTVRKSIELLIKENVLVKQRGKGTYVMHQPKIQSGRAGLQGFTEAAKAYGKSSETKVIAVEKLKKLENEIIEALDLEPDAEVIHITRVRSLENDPMTVEDLYVKSEYLPDISESVLTGSLFKEIEKNVEIAYSHQEIEAVLVTKTLSELLKVPINQPALMVHSTTYSVSAVPILYDISYYRADKYTFKNTLHRHIKHN